MIQLTKKQIEYTQQAKARWNFKSGAVRSGKSFVDISNVIPERIIERIGLPGLAVIIGVSRDTIERNVLQPMREIYGDKRVGIINSRNTVNLFGENVYCLGAEKISQVAKIQGASIKYCYGDEVAKWNKEVFEMLKSRLDKSYSCFDGSLNPENPTHWLKAFLESDADIYLQEYSIFDNTFLPKSFIDNLCKEYRGTIYYDRYILGLWKRAEGSIYRVFADEPASFKRTLTRKEIDNLKDITVGVDFGGNQSGHSFVATAMLDNCLIGLKSRRIMQKDYSQGIDSNLLDKLLLDFIKEVEEKYGNAIPQKGKIEYLYWDNAESVLGNTIRNAIETHWPNIIVKPALKARIKDRIDCAVRLIGSRRFFITEDCPELEAALTDAVWDKTKQEDVRLDDGTSDIDTLDAFEYTYERDIKYLIEEA